SALSSHSQHFRRSDYVRDLGLDAGPGAEVRVFGLSRWLGVTFHEIWRATTEGMYGKWAVGPWRLGTLVGLSVAVQVFAFGFIAYGGVRGWLTLTTVVVALQAVLRVDGMSADSSVRAGALLL